MLRQGEWYAKQEGGRAHYWPASKCYTFAICGEVMIVGEPSEEALKEARERAQDRQRCKNCLRFRTPRD